MPIWERAVHSVYCMCRVYASLPFGFEEGSGI